MKRIYCSDLRKMSQEDLFKLNETLDKLANKFGKEWSTYVVKCGEEVDQATEAEECRYHFIHYVYAKEDEILDFIGDLNVLELADKFEEK